MSLEAKHKSPNWKKTEVHKTVLVPLILWSLSAPPPSQWFLWTGVLSQNSYYLRARPLSTPTGILSPILNKLIYEKVSPSAAPRSSDEAEELLPAAPGEGFHPPFREPPLFAFSCFVLNGGKDGCIKGLLQVLLREGGTLDVVGRPDLLGDAPGPGAQHGLDVGAVQVDEDVHVQ